MKTTKMIEAALLAAVLLMPSIAGAQPVGTAFTYQGQLAESGRPVHDRVDFTFRLWNAETGGSQIGSPITLLGEPVNNGLFTVELDFGDDIFIGGSRWLAISVNGTSLTPRQHLTPAPYAMALPGLWTQQDDTSPNLIGGSIQNTVQNGAFGATIGGGGTAGAANTVYDQYTTVGGGKGNTAGSSDGDPRTARGATVVGGTNNTASGINATVAGGADNVAAGTSSLAAGQQALATDDGTFVWADASGGDFQSSGPNQFLIRAQGGVGIGTNAPSEELDVVGTVKMRGIQIVTAPSAGYVLTSDGEGVGSWQPGAGGSVWETVGSDIYYSTGSVGIGLEDPLTAKLHVVNAGLPAIRAVVSSSSGGAIEGQHDDNHGYVGYSTAGILGSSPDGIGVRGTSENHWPVAGISPYETGVVGVVGAIKLDNGSMPWTPNSGVSGGTQSGYGVAGRSKDGIGVYGRQTDSENVGHLGTSEAGVYGEHGTTDNHGSLGTANQGAYGEHDASGNYGALGTADEGVYGRHVATGQYGALGRSTAAVYGWAQTGYGGDFYSNQGTAARFRNYRGDGVLVEHDAQDQNTAALKIESTGTEQPIGLDVTMDADSGKLASFDLNGAGGYLSPAFHVEAETSGRVAEFIGQYAGSSNPTVYAETAGTGNAVRAIHSRASDNQSAIYGQHDETPGMGTGVEGVGGHRGLYGHVAAAGYGDHFGVYATVNGGNGSNYAVYGEAAGGLANFAGYFAGDVWCYGQLTKGGGTFKIDHPLDPENKYLCHSFVESPDMMNIYNGNVVLDGRGEAVVTMPDWFEPLNRDFRYQLTCIGGFAQVYIAEEIANNQFKIAGGEPGLKVSWQVTGVRQDPYANANRVQVEVDKPESERGTYLHPEAWGVSPNLRLDRVREARMAQGADAVLDD